MRLDPVILSRLQFAFVIAFHFLLPAFTIGLASYIAVLEGLHLATKKQVYPPVAQILLCGGRKGRRLRVLTSFKLFAGHHRGRTAKGERMGGGELGRRYRCV